MKVYKAVITALSLIFTPYTLAGTMGGRSCCPEVWRPFVALSAGPFWNKAGKTQTINLTPFYQQTYTVDSHSKVAGSGEVVLGLQNTFFSCLQAQLGIAGAYTSNVRIAGDIWQGADPDFNNFNYSYKIKHAHLAAKGKLLGKFHPFIQPYLSGSIGFSINRSFHFRSERKIPEVTEQAPFGAYTSGGFTYTLGAGLQKPLTPNLALGLGYEFADWGQSKLIRSAAQVVDGALSLQHFYTHQLQMTLSFVC